MSRHFPTSFRTGQGTVVLRIPALARRHVAYGFKWDDPLIITVEPDKLIIRKATIHEEMDGTENLDEMAEALTETTEE